jgi:regulator of protease activity HflC (stomatin/prohibitin superfamily)
MPFAPMMLLQAEVLGGFLLIFVLFVLGIVMLVTAVKTIKIVPQATVMLIERLGRFSRVASSGLNIIVPFIDKPRAVYWTNMRRWSGVDRPARTIH